MGEQIARAAAGAHELAYGRRRNVERGYRYDDDTAGAREMYRKGLLHAAGGVLARERLRHGVAPALHRETGAVRDRDVCKAKELVPSVPRGEFEKCIGAKE